MQSHIVRIQHAISENHIFVIRLPHCTDSQHIFENGPCNRIGRLVPVNYADIHLLHGLADVEGKLFNIQPFVVLAVVEV